VKFYSVFFVNGFLRFGFTYLFSGEKLRSPIPAQNSSEDITTLSRASEAVEL
jgi:hypothetical protein